MEYDHEFLKLTFQWTGKILILGNMGIFKKNYQTIFLGQGLDVNFPYELLTIVIYTFNQNIYACAFS